MESIRQCILLSRNNLFVPLERLLLKTENCQCTSRQYSKGEKGKKEKDKGKSDCKGKESAPPPPPPQQKAPKLKTFQIYRYNPAVKNSKPRMQSYTIDLNDCRPTVLDALFKIKMEQDSTLTYRRSCREGICGSCGMNVDGVNRLACLNKIKPSGTTKIYPLPHMYVIKDLVVDFNQFLGQHNRIRPYLMKKLKKGEGAEQLLQSIKDRDALDGFVECVLCACCSTSCPEYWWHGHSKPPNDFMGPSALLNAYRWVMDSRDECTEDRLAQLNNYYSVYRCHQINNCTNTCPKKLEPGKAIARLRLLISGLRAKKKADLEGSVPAQPEKACNKGCK